jgi:uncharacterized protein (DUF4415 family)
VERNAFISTASATDDADDAPELDAAWFAGATVMDGDRVIRAGRPPLPPGARRQAVTMRLPQHVVAYFRGTGRGWQRRVATLLEEHVEKLSKSQDKAR